MTPIQEAIAVMKKDYLGKAGRGHPSEETNIAMFLLIEQALTDLHDIASALSNINIALTRIEERY